MELNNKPYVGEARLPFLGAVARAYVSRYEEMSDICFVFPNKRSGSFFLKNLSENLGDRSMLAPEVLDVGSFMAKVSGLEVASRIDLLFRLYTVYCSLVGKTGSLRTESDLLDFDRFAPWGEVLTGDFSEVEQYCADADALFRNVRDYRSIASNFLTEEQCDMIERYFGYRPASESVERFWRSVGPEEDLTVLKEKFVELWRLLPELFEGLIANLEADGLALPGTSFRRAMERVEADGMEALPWSHVVVVGFNMLSTSEARLFASLRDMRDADGEPFAEFLWDATGPVLGGEMGSRSPAAMAMKRNISNFPMPAWAMPFLDESSADAMPDSITVSAAPSNAAQAKIAGRVVAGWLEKVDADHIKDARAAIVVPDENLLMPLLHSLPAGLKAVNLTMGYSLRFTSVASFIFHLRRLQSRRRKTGGDIGYYFEDVRLFLSHPLVHVVTGSDLANRINGDIGRKHLRVITPGWLEEYSPELAAMLQPIPGDATVSETVDYVDRVLALVDRALAHGRDGLRTVNSKIERSQIAVYRMALTRLLHSVRRHGISMRFMSVFHLVDRILAGEKVTFEGEPLEGLQVMGLLETRALDFDHLIILSMNDKIMPRRSRGRTFIPDALRKGYGLPTSSQAEELYSYYFYRLLSRVRDVTLIYDARAGEGMRSGGKSRYLMQLEMLYARDAVRKENYTFMLDSVSTSPRSVTKTPKVMEMLDAFTRREGGRNLSASALMNYCACQVRFYFKNVVGINDDSPAVDYIDPITQGQIVHSAMLELYFPEGLRNKYLKGPDRIILTESLLESMVNDRRATERAVRHAVNHEHFHLKDEELDRPLDGTVAIVAERLVSQVEDVMRHDMGIAPVELVGGEIDGNVRWKAGDAPEVNMRYAFDRVDIVGGKLRIVDYKTGSSHVEAEQFEDVFTGAYKAKYMLQLLLYSHLLEERVAQEEGRAPGDVGMFIYDVNTILKEGAVMPGIAKKTLDSHKTVSAMFMESMESMLRDIFNADIPFEPTADEANCAYCTLRALCGRE